MRKIVDETSRVEHVFCDRCGEQKDFTYGGGGSCCACGRDVCRDCNVYDDHQGGDYPDVYCRECWEIGEPFRERQAAAESECERIVEAAQKEWVKACECGDE